MQIPDDALCKKAFGAKSDGNACKYLENDGLCSIAIKMQKEDPANRMPTLCAALALSIHLRANEQSKGLWQARTAADQSKLIGSFFIKFKADKSKYSFQDLLQINPLQYFCQGITNI